MKSDKFRSGYTELGCPQEMFSKQLATQVRSWKCNCESWQLIDGG